MTKKHTGISKQCRFGVVNRSFRVKNSIEKRISSGFRKPLEIQNNNDKLTLLGMSFVACHGCLPEEMTTPQPFVVDAVLYLPLKAAGSTDDISLTVDYTQVFALTKKIVTGKSVKLIETLAEKIAAALFAAFPIIEKLEITVHKPNSPLTECTDDVKASICRKNPCISRL